MIILVVSNAQISKIVGNKLGFIVNMIWQNSYWEICHAPIMPRIYTYVLQFYVIPGFFYTRRSTLVPKYPFIFWYLVKRTRQGGMVEYVSKEMG